MQLVRRTIPFFISRIIVYGIFFLISIVFLGLMLGLCILLFNLFEFGSGFLLLIIIGTFFTVLGGLRFAERYFLYLVKVGHVAVITELLRNGEVPDGKSQLSYGKEQVKENFGSANVAFVVDNIIYGAIRQIQRWMMRIGNFFSFIPGAKNIIGILTKIMEVSLRYVDESILSYIFLRKKEGKEESVWKSACDGVVLYAQSWKKVMTTSVGIVAFVYVCNFLLFIISVFPLVAIASAIASNSGVASFLGFLAVVGAYTFTTVMKRAFIDPVAMIAMIRAYQTNIKGLEPSMDLQEKLLGISKKFRELFNKSKEDTKNNQLGTATNEDGMTPTV